MFTNFRKFTTNNAFISGNDTSINLFNKNKNQINDSICQSIRLEDDPRKFLTTFAGHLRASMTGMGHKHGRLSSAPGSALFQNFQTI